MATRNAVNVTAHIVNENRIKVYLHNLPDKVQNGITNGLQLGGRELRDYIKYDLLEGKLVKKRSGELQKGIFLTRDDRAVYIVIRGKHAQIGEWIDQGLAHTWIIRARRKKRLYFQMADGKWFSGVQVTHPGIKPRHFLRKGAEEKRLRVAQLVRQEIRKEIQNAGS